MTENIERLLGNLEATQKAHGKALAEVQDTLGDIREKIGCIVNSIKRVDDHETRLRGLEVSKHRSIGAVAAIGSTTGFAAALVAVLAYFGITR